MYDAIKTLDSELQKLRRELYATQCRLISGTEITKARDEKSAAILDVKIRNHEHAIKTLRDIACKESAEIAGFITKEQVI